LGNPLTNEINSDTILIKLFTNKSYYNSYKKYISNYLISNYKTNNKLLFKLYRCLELLHSEHESVSLEDIFLRLQREYPALPADERDLAQETLQKASQAIFNDEEVVGLVQQQYEAAKASEVALKAIQVSEGKATLAELQELLGNDDLSETLDEESYFYENDLQGLFESTKGANGHRWPLDCLNKSLGSLRPGDFGFLFARPETGKTTFLAHTATHMVQTSRARVLWVNNEEGGNKVLLRCYQAALGLTNDALFGDVEGNQRRYAECVGDNLRILNDPGIKAKDLDRVIADYRPTLILFDQLDKVEGFEKSERNDLILKAKYQWAREIAKRHHCAVIGVCQAGGTAENKKRLVMTDVDSSHTAKQGEADWVLGIGMVADEGMENVRYFSICKNKLVGDADSVEGLRHGHFDAIIQPTIAQYRDRRNWK
jgi:hypothetical protein